MIQVIFMLVCLLIAGSRPEEDKWINGRNEK